MNSASPARKQHGNYFCPSGTNGSTRSIAFISGKSFSSWEPGERWILEWNASAEFFFFFWLAMDVTLVSWL